MLDLTARQRVLQLPGLLAQIAGAGSPAVVLLDNIEVLFDVALQQDPLRLLQGLSRNMVVVAAWNGSVQGGHLLYADPNHSEYKRYVIEGFLVVSVSDS